MFAYNGKECEGVYYNGQPCPMYANGMKIWPTTQIYDGLTISANGKITWALDPHIGKGKSEDSTYVVSGENYSVQYKNRSPVMDIVPSAGVFTTNVLQNPYSGVEQRTGHYGWTTPGLQAYTSDCSNLEINVLSFDFFKYKVFGLHIESYSNSSVFRQCLTIPQTTANIHNYENLTHFGPTFSGNKRLTGKLEGFIKSMKQLKPDLSVSAVFRGCTNAQDYQHCLTAYPEWF